MRPQHFQQQERYWESFVNERLCNGAVTGWGLTELAIDATALTVGRFEVTSLAAVMRDGTPLRAPRNAALPPPRRFAAEARDRRVLLALPIRRPDAAEVSDSPDATPGHRWTPRQLSLRDASSGEDVKCQVRVGVLAPTLLLEGENADEFETLPIARIRSASDMKIRLDDGYLPPVMDCRAHEGYQRQLGEVHSLLSRRAEALCRQLDPNTAAGLADLRDFLLLQAVNRYEAAVTHLLQISHLDPERAFALLVELAGELGSFLPESRPHPPPAYDHLDPGPGWKALRSRIDDSLGTISERQGVQLPLRRQPNGSLVAMVEDRSLLDSARFILIVRMEDTLALTTLPSALGAPQGTDSRPAAAAPEPGSSAPDRGHQLETRIKIGSVDRLREIVSLQLPGVPCSVVRIVPRGLPYHADAAYLEVDTSAPRWKDVRESGGLALYLLGGGSNTIQLWAVRSGHSTTRGHSTTMEEDAA